jgi:hypothetical protein
MSAAPRSRNSRSHRRAVRPRLESLEPRLALAASATLGAAARVAIVGDTLTVVGTPGPDRIQILPTRLPGTVRVVFDGKLLGSYGPVASIYVSAGAGNDTIVVDPRITLPTRLDGGAGNDRLRGGSGPNILLGGNGNDTLIGNPVRDTLDGGSGTNRLVALKSLGMIQVGPSASGAALRSLSGAYTLRPLQVSGPAVVGAADLRNGRIASQLRRDYVGGQTVALTNATANDAAALASMLGYPEPVDFPADVRRADLVAFRKVNEGGRTIFSTSVLLPQVNVPTTPAARAAGNQANIRGDRAYLDRIFTATPALPAPPRGADPQTNLLQLANAYQSSFRQRNSAGYAAQEVNTVYAARSFSNQIDLYYVDQEIDVDGRSMIDPSKGAQVFSRSFSPDYRVNPPFTLQPSPQSNSETTTTTSGVNYTIGGSIGWNQMQGFNASISGGVTIVNTMSTTVPPIRITNQGDLSTGTTAWLYETTTPQGIQSGSFFNQWIWQVPFTAYAANQTNFGFQSELSNIASASSDDLSIVVNSRVPIPFGDTFQLSSPKVTGVSPATVKPGDTFTIAGTALYPALVQAVLIGGQALNPANFTPVSDTQIQVVAPNTPGSSLPVVVKTSQGLSNADVTINIAGTSQVNARAQPVAAVAGQALTNVTVATLTDSDLNANPAGFTATIGWGDGTTSNGTVTAAGPGNFNVSGTHTYLAADTYTFGVQVTDPSGSKATATGTATVSAPNAGGPQNLVARPVAAVAGQAFTNVTMATFTDSDPNASPADFTASITWGDGITTPSTTVTAAGPGTFNVLGTHTYLAADTYTFGVQVTDSQGRKATASGTATVSSA